MCVCVCMMWKQNMEYIKAFFFFCLLFQFMKNTC